ncbi:glutaminase family protein [Sphingomonas sp. PR090111-T3T-6A]|uniref:glutaminase family protein n=1 Tax=Sphingomonas sp. PR090111-T3T-6A TaxID=685778 RepID=UPI000374AD5D|nr:glutaminase family protein [Sphingomonas sp. PR090111-T3T-6A]
MARNRIYVFGATLAMLASVSPAAAQQAVTARTPATPLVAHDPYFSLWSFGDQLAADQTRHWTGAEQQLNGWVRVDGRLLRFMGAGKGDSMMQQSRAIWPTRTIYEFEDGGVHLTATFFTPALADDLDVLSRPVTYLSWTVRSTDGKSHAVQLYVDASAELAIDNTQQQVVWGSSRVGDMTVMRLGTKEQPVLQKSGDNLRIDWGWAELAVPQQAGAATAIVGESERDRFLKDGSFATTDDLAMPRAAREDAPRLAIRFDFGAVDGNPETRRAMLAYDDLDSIEYLKRRLPAYWRRNGMTMAELLAKAEKEEASLERRGEAFDRELVSDLERAGGRSYAELAVLAYRQTLAAHKLVADVDGTPLLFSKENFSNGCIDTVDVTYPSSPFFLLFNPRLLEAQLRPIMEYAALPRWRFPFAPHDLGTYPLANGQVYGGGERTENDQMPVEETGNMLLMIGALAKAQGNADFAAKFWPQISRWAAYLAEKGLDPENQLSTDDFAGHLAHNTNLSIKAILALDSYATLARRLGKKEEAARYQALARGMAAKWPVMAKEGDHTRLAFDQPGTWSQKYNLVWDKVLGLGLFPKTLFDQEVSFYLRKQQPFGLSLDSRKTYTKLDWITWSATLSDRKEDFEALLDPVHRYMTESPSRVPLSDWYEATDGKQVGFQARSVVGGVYMKMLADPQLWKKWANRAGQ